jgi:iron-sulfur cluster repair protein YtfE (RIC family)
MTRTLTEPLRSRHDELRPKVEQIAAAARTVPELDEPGRRAAIQPIVDFLQGELRRHAEAEEQWLYPEIAFLLRHPLATATMSFDHRLLREHVDALAAEDGRDPDALQARLYAIHALLDAHFRKEEELYFAQLEMAGSAATVAAIEQEMARYEEGVQGAPGGPAPLDLERVDFPATGAPVEKLIFLLRYAALAPSSHNSQPWIVRPAGDDVLVYADRSRALPVVDPDDRELLMSCGAFVHHLRASIVHYGFEPVVELFPTPADSDLLARVGLGAERPPTYQERLLFWAIRLRRTNRRAFDPRPVPAELLAELVSGAAREGAWLVSVPAENRDDLAELVMQADRRQLADRSFRGELAAWMHSSRARSRDGMRGDALGVPALLSAAGPLAVRTFDIGNGVAARDRKLVDASPELLVLGTKADTPADWLAAGQALSAVLVRAAQDGVCASFLNQPVEVPELRPRVAELAGRAGFPQVVLRMGYGAEARAAPRRPVSDFVEVDGYENVCT